MTQIVQKSQPQKCFFFRCCQIREGSLISENTLNRTLNQVFVQYIGQNDQNTYIISCIISQILQKEIWVRKKLPNAAESYQIPSYKFPCYQIPRYRIPLQVTKYLATKLLFNYQLPNPASQCYQIPQSNLSGRFQVTI